MFRDGNSLNCTQENLIRCTRADILHNQTVNRRNSSGYKGVSRLSSGRYRAYICIGGSRKYLGTFPTAPLAARAYNDAALESFGTFAWINPLPDGA